MTDKPKTPPAAKTPEIKQAPEEQVERAEELRSAAADAEADPDPRLTTPDPEQEEEHDDPGTPSIQSLDSGWHLVTHRTWQVSVGPDGLLMLPRHIHPREWDDFVAAGAAAIKLGHDIIAKNEHAAVGDDRSPTMSRRALVTEGGVPEGAVRMMTRPGANAPAHTSAIGGRGARQSTSQAGPLPAGTQGIPVRARAPQAKKPTIQSQ